MKKTILLAFAPLVLAGCFDYGQPPTSVYFYYQAQGLCQGVKITAIVGSFFEKGVVQAIEQKSSSPLEYTYTVVGTVQNNSFTLPRGLAKNDVYQVVVGRTSNAYNNYPTSLQLQCLPNSPTLAGAMPAQTGARLRIIEDPTQPSNLRTEQVILSSSN
ncbi:MAG: hypothetical protein IVW51_18905 [Thermaceae bacterium]|nr:hypothetical protein [Thermaceae bacterium]